MAPDLIIVRAKWDPEARVFVATSDDVPGLVAEGESLDALVEKLSVLVPELLELNNPGGAATGYRDVPLAVLSERVATVRVPA
jgi:hypothetical protein